MCFRPAHRNSDTDDNLDAFGVAPVRSGGNFAAERKVTRRMPLPNSHFSVEMDDALVGYQTATGIVETRAGKSFLVEKRDLVASSLRGVELPIPIHYRCDQLGLVLSPDLMPAFSARGWRGS